ncbi:polyketide synthase dehydratase-domain-containing protein [Ustulina deusta]|nr:polyketide synthase dehydratase-domain-containing protein [Ustulina deusta]
MNWPAVNIIDTTGLVMVEEIPPYPWDYSNPILWHESRPSIELHNRQYSRHELLGSRQLAGNGIDVMWRNVLRLSEASWLREHKLEAQTVFPAAGYLSLAIEGLRQFLNPDADAKEEASLSFEFRNVNIKTALVRTDEDRTEVELHTLIYSTNPQLRQQVVRTAEPSPIIDPVEIRDSDVFEDRPQEPWYRRLKETGLNLGPLFQSLTSRHETTECLQQTKLHARKLAAKLDWCLLVHRTRFVDGFIVILIHLGVEELARPLQQLIQANCIKIHQAGNLGL